MSIQRLLIYASLVFFAGCGDSEKTDKRSHAEPNGHSGDSVFGGNQAVKLSSGQTVDECRLPPQSYASIGLNAACNWNEPKDCASNELMTHNREKKIHSRFHRYSKFGLRARIQSEILNGAALSLTPTEDAKIYIDTDDLQSICQNYVSYLPAGPELITEANELSPYGEMDRILRCDYYCPSCSDSRYQLLNANETFIGAVDTALPKQKELSASCTIWGDVKVADDKKSASLTVRWSGEQTGGERIVSADLNGDSVATSGSKTYDLGAGSVPSSLKLTLLGGSGSVKTCKYIPTQCLTEVRKPPTSIKVEIAGAQDSFRVMETITRWYATPPMGWVEHRMSGFGALNHEKRIPIQQLFSPTGCMYEQIEPMRYNIGRVTTVSRIIERAGNDIACGGDFGDTIQVLELTGIVSTSGFSVEATVVDHQRAEKLVSYDNRDDVFYFCALSGKQWKDGLPVGVKSVPGFAPRGVSGFALPSNPRALQGQHAYLSPTYDKYPMSLKLGFGFYPTDFEALNCLGHHPEHCLYPYPRNGTREIDVTISKE